MPGVTGRIDAAQWLTVWAALLAVTLLAIHRLRDFPAHLSWTAALAGVSEVWRSTAWAAVKVWSFWAWGAAIVAGLVVRLDPEIETSDAILIGAAGLWPLGYVLGNLLGPIGLFNTATIWGLLALGSAWLWRNRPQLRRDSLSAGQKLAALAVGLLAVSYLALQLASPLVPFMDVLSYPASVQRILTFHTYLPFDNDPYGCWGPYAQTPGLELFYAFLALGSHTKTGALAESAAMLPMAALVIFATWRLGKTIFGDTAGGIASMFLFFTCLFRRAQGMRGTAVDFVLVAIGLALMMDRRRRPILVGAGGLFLGGAIASHSIDGAFATIVAGVGVLTWLADGGFRDFAAGAIVLAGALMLGAPDIAISLQYEVAYPILPLLILAGIATIVYGSSVLSVAQRRSNDDALRVVQFILLSTFVFLVLYRHSVEPFTLYAQVAGNLPMLFLFAFGGLVIAIGLVLGDDPLTTRSAGLVAVALMLGVAGEYLDPILRAVSRTPTTGMMTSDIGIKLFDYWCPFFLTLPAGLLFAYAYDRWSRPLTFFVLLTLLIYPWSQIKDPVDYDSVEHAITEQWAFNLATAADGYWSGHADRRWTFSDPEWALYSVLQAEIAAGRITASTHVLHLVEDISSWSMVQMPVLTGINDDPIEIHHDPNNLWEGGGRVRGMNQLADALARRPPYILTQMAIPAGVGDPPPGYDLISNGDWLRLYRRHDLANVVVPRRGGLVRSSLGVLLIALALFVAIRREPGSAAARVEAAADTSSAVSK